MVKYFCFMRFEKIEPSENLSHLIKEFWIYENADTSSETQKVIPDGFSEIIIHYGDPYKIKMDDQWKLQSPLLFSNQISKYFFLENTGASAMIGVKLHPTSFFHLFGVDLAPYTDRVVPLEKLPIDLSKLSSLIQPEYSSEERIGVLEQWFESSLRKEKLFDAVNATKAVEVITQKNGLIDIKQTSQELGLSERQLERSFKKATGVTPKFYSRIIRFNYIFSIIKNGNDSWVRVALESGYFDQSHFIKDFKEFTGEEPSTYGFDDENLANFFLKK